MSENRRHSLWVKVILLSVLILLLLYIYLPSYNPIKRAISAGNQTSAVLLVVLFILTVLITYLDLNYGLYILIVSLAFETMVRVYGSVDIATTEVILSALIIISLLRLVKDEEKIEFIKEYLFALLFLMATVITTAMAPDKLATLKQIVRWLEMFLIFIVLYHKRKEIKLNRILRFSFIVFGLTSMVAIVQRFVELTPQYIPYYEYSFGGILRSYSTFTHPNVMAIYLGAFAILLLGAFTSSLKERNVRDSIIYYSLFLLFNIAIMLSFSRGGLFALITGYIVFFAVTRKKVSFTKKDLLFIIPILIGIVIFVFLYGSSFYHYLKETVLSFTSSDIAGHDKTRFDYFYSSVEMIKERPIFGWGSLGTDISVLEQTADKFSIPYIKGNIIGWFHSTYLSLMVEFGLLGFILFIIYSLSLLWKSFVEGQKTISGNALRIAFVVILINAVFKVILIKSIHIFAGLVIALSFVHSTGIGERRRMDDKEGVET